MSDSNIPMHDAAPGESPETLSYLQVLFAHVYILGGILMVLGLWHPEIAGLRHARIILGIVCGLVSLRWVFQIPRLKAYEMTVLGAVLVAIAALIALSLSPVI